MARPIPREAPVTSATLLMALEYSRSATPSLARSSQDRHRPRPASRQHPSPPALLPAQAVMEAAGARPLAFAFEPEVVGRTPRVAVGKLNPANIERVAPTLGVINSFPGDESPFPV